MKKLGIDAPLVGYLLAVRAPRVGRRRRHLELGQPEARAGDRRPRRRGRRDHRDRRGDRAGRPRPERRRPRGRSSPPTSSSATCCSARSPRARASGDVALRVAVNGEEVAATRRRHRGDGRPRRARAPRRQDAQGGRRVARAGRHGDLRLDRARARRRARRRGRGPPGAAGQPHRLLRVSVRHLERDPRGHPRRRRRRAVGPSGRRLPLPHGPRPDRGRAPDRAGDPRRPACGCWRRRCSRRSWRSRARRWRRGATATGRRPRSRACSTASGSCLIEPDLPSGTRSRCAPRAPGSSSRSIPAILAGLRERKAPDELEQLRAAGREADAAMEWVAGADLDGRSERWLALELQMRFLGRGVEPYDYVIASRTERCAAAPRDRGDRDQRRRAAADRLRLRRRRLLLGHDARAPAGGRRRGRRGLRDRRARRTTR